MRSVISLILSISSCVLSPIYMLLKFGGDSGLGLDGNGVECATCTAMNNFEPS